MNEQVQAEPQVTCFECREPVADEDIMATSEGNGVCSDCLRSCERCDWYGTESDDWHNVQDDRYCQDCYENHTFYCDYCESTYDSDRGDYSRVDGDIWCDDCTGAHAYWCDNCDEYRRGDGCESCGSDDLDGLIHNYSYKPNPVFHGDASAANNLFMGLELEMELNNISSSEYAKAVEGVSDLDKSDVCYLKHDASIRGTGFELVTHPHTLESYNRNDALWNYIETLRTTYAARSWDTESCGLHVHVSRAAFKSGAHTHRFLALVYKNPKEMMKLAGRKNSRYARFNDVYQQDEWGIPRFQLADKIHRGFATERYAAVNTNNDYTLELRFFRGNMKREGIMSALELCHASVEYTRDLTLSDVKLGALTWEWFADWVASNNGIYPNLYMRMSKVHMVSLDNRPLLNA